MNRDRGFARSEKGRRSNALGEKLEEGPQFYETGSEEEQDLLMIGEIL